ncbi:MAG: methyltransferase domain-containing protein, partial [Syntrophomonadaceae bacterium]
SRMERETDLPRVLADEVRAAIAEASPAPREEVAGGDPATAEARALLSRATDLMTPSVPRGSPLEPVKRLAIRALRFLWRNQSSFDALALDASTRLVEALERFRLETGRALETLDRRAAIAEGRLSLLETRSPAAEPATAAGAAAPGAIPPGVYALFEERFRGRPEEIAAGQRDYLRWLRGLPGPVLDVGCGRGEFLRLLQGAGIPASGIESNAISAAACRAAGLDVGEGDGLALLSARPAGSLGAVVAFQVVEHWPPETIFRFLREARRATAPGGVLILETVNTDSLFSLRTFYLDPTHVRPVPPDALRFLAEAVGFADIVVERRAPVPDAERLEERSENDRKLNALLFGPQDYALVARVAAP